MVLRSERKFSQDAVRFGPHFRNMASHGRARRCRAHASHRYQQFWSLLDSRFAQLRSNPSGSSPSRIASLLGPIETSSLLPTRTDRLHRLFAARRRLVHPLGYGHRIRLVLQQPIVREIATRHKKTAAQVVLRWGVQRGTAVIPKTSQLARLRENIDIYDFALTAEEMKAISNLDKHQRFNDPVSSASKPSAATTRSLSSSRILTLSVSFEVALFCFKGKALLICIAQPNGLG